MIHSLQSHTAELRNIHPRAGDFMEPAWLDLIADHLSEFLFSLLEHDTGTIIAIPAKDDHTGISSLEELSVSASIRGRTEAADIQEAGKDRPEIVYSGRPVFITIPHTPVDLSFLKGLSRPDGIPGMVICLRGTNRSLTAEVSGIMEN